MIRITAICFFLLISIDILSQDLKDKFPDSEIAFEEFISTYEYVWDEALQHLKVIQTDEIVLISLKTNARFSWPVFFNDEIRPQHFSLRDQKGRKINYEKVCGHVEQSGIFYSDSKACFYDFSFNLKNEYIRLRSGKLYNDPRYLTKINLQSILPGQSRTIKIIWPEWVEVELVDFNFEKHIITKLESSEDQKKSIQYSWKWPSGLNNEEKNTPSSTFYSPHLIALTKGYTHPTTGEKINLINDVGSLYGWYRLLVSNVENNRDSLKHIVSDLTKDKADYDKIKSIYYWVQDNIKYIAFEDGIMGFQPEDAHKVFYNKYGDCKGMANLLKTMLEIAGFDARLSWLGTNHLPYSYEIPSLAVDNHMICSVIQDDRTIYLDATIKYNKLSYVPGHIQGKEILIEAGDDFLIKTLPVANSTQNFEKIDLEMEILNGTLKSHGKIQMEGDSKQYFLYMYNNLWSTSKDRFVRDFISQFGETQDFNFEIKKAHRDSVLVIDIFNESDKLLNEYGKDLYVQMEIRNELSVNKIDLKRNAPYAFENRRHINSLASLKIPEGYKVSFIPEPLNVSTNSYEFLIQYEILENEVRYKKSIHIKDLIIDNSQFKSWNESINKLIEYYNNPIILINAN